MKCSKCQTTETRQWRPNSVYNNCYSKEMYERRKITITSFLSSNPPTIKRTASATSSSGPPLKKKISTTGSNPPLKKEITTTASNPPTKTLRLVCSPSLNPPPTKKVRLSPGDSHSLEFSNEFIRYRDNLFNIMPQKPQFKPLEKYYSSFRNGMKLILDLEFTNLAQRLPESVDPIEFLDKIDEYSSRLTTLEEMGYDVVTLKGQLITLEGYQKTRT
ncbi:hypothetical protein MKX01_040350 [Papaver californicum]|nr:hypothetical protein MKX01_040350 [Papaver californicum]